MNDNEHVVTIQPSQWTNAGWFILTIVAGVIYLPLGGVLLVISIYKYLEVDTWRYDLNMRTIQEKKGVFSVTTEEIQYYRIKSIMVDEPLWMRFFGLSIVRIISSEQHKPHMILYAVEQGEYLKNMLSEHAHEWRKELGIRDYDIYNS